MGLVQFFADDIEQYAHIDTPETFPEHGKTTL